MKDGFSNTGFEIDVIGAGLSDPVKLSLILETLQEENFFSQKRREIFRGMRNLFDKGVPVDVETLSLELQEKGILASELVEIEDEYIDRGESSLSYRIEEIKDFSRRRKLLGLIEQIQDPSVDFSEISSKIKTILDGSQARNQPLLKIITPGDVFQFEKPAPLIVPIIYQGTVNLFNGPPGKGKSLITHSLLKSVLTGSSLWGRYRVAAQGPALLIDEETPRSFLKDRFEKTGISEDLPLSILHFQGIQVDRSSYIEALLRMVREIKPILVVFDSLIRFHSQNENEAGAMSRVMGAFRKIANEGTTVWIIHHHRKGDGPLDQKARGSGDIVGGVDTEFSIIEKDGVLTFSSVKTRVEPFGPIQLKLEVEKDRIRVTYQGTEEDNLRAEIKEILQDRDHLTVSEILESLRDRRVDTGINKVRNVLKFSNNGIIGVKEKTGKTYRTVYFLNEVKESALGTLHGLPPINRGVNPLSVNPTLYGGSEKEENAREALTLDSKGIADASRVENRRGSKSINREVNASRAGVESEGGAVKRKIDGIEVLEDGQATY